MAIFFNPNNRNLGIGAQQKKNQPQPQTKEDSQAKNPQINPQVISGDKVLDLMAMQSVTVTQSVLTTTRRGAATATESQVVEERDSNGNVTKRTTTTTTDDGKTVLEEFFNAAGKPTKTIKTEYDKNGNIKDKTTSVYEYSKTGTDMCVVTVYDKNNKKVRTEKHINGTNEITKYDSNGNQIEKALYNADGNIVWLSKYDSNGNFKTLKYDEKGRITDVKTNDYEASYAYDKNGNCNSKTTIYNNGEFELEALVTNNKYTKITGKYTSEGYRITTEMYKKDGTHTIEIADENGKVLSKKTEKVDKENNPVFKKGLEVEEQTSEATDTNRNAEFEQKANGFIADFKAEKYTLDTAKKYLSEIGATVKGTRTEGNKTIITFTLDGKEYTAEAVLYDKDGFDCLGFDRQGYDKDGFNTNGVNRKGQTRGQVKAEAFVSDFKSGKYTKADAIKYLSSIGAKSIRTGTNIVKVRLTFSVDGKNYSAECSIVKLALAGLRKIFG